MNDNFSIYRMENNSFLGDCMAIIYQANSKEVQSDGLTSPDVAIYVKTPIDITTINTISDVNKRQLFNMDKSVILRVASECQFGIFGDSHCDCESQRTASMEAINAHGQGVYVQLPQEGQGRGLHYKARELQIQIHGTDPAGKFIGKKDIYEACKTLTGTTEVDIRGLNTLRMIFSVLGLNKYNYVLVSSNPKKAAALAEDVGITIIGSQDVQRVLNIDNVGEYLAKIYKKGFSLSEEDLREIYDVLFNARYIPERAKALLGYINDDLNLGKTFSLNMELLRKIANLAVSEHRGQVPIHILDDPSGERYREYQVEIAISDNDADKLFSSHILDSINDVSFEQNYFYDLAYLKNTITRDLKIRCKTSIDHEKRLLESRMIYKTPVGSGEYDIRNIAINEKEIVDLLSNSLEGYEVHYVPVFTHNISYRADADLVILIKRYSSTLRTLSVMGKKASVKKMMQRAQEVIDLKILPDPTNIRTVNRDLSLDFEYATLSDEESKFFEKYKEKQ